MNNARHIFRHYLVFALLAVSLGLMMFVFALRSPGAQRAAQTFSGVKMTTNLLPPGATSSNVFNAKLTEPAPHAVKLAWFQSTNAAGDVCRGWQIMESTNLRTWTVAATITNTNGRGGWFTNSFTSSANPAFWKVGAW